MVEQSTGEISFGAGFSTTSGILGDISIRERNLLGKGQDLRLGLSLGTLSTLIDLSFTEPYFLDRNVAAGFDLFRTSNDRQNIVMLECADGRQVQPVWRDVWTEVAPGVQTSCSQNTQRVRLTGAACPMRIEFEHISEYVSYSDREFCRQSRSRYWVNYVALPAEV